MTSQMFRAAGATLLLLKLISDPVHADELKKDDSKKVVVSGMRNPELKNYRIMHAGVVAFEENHQLAPKAVEIRFKVRARKIAGPNPYEGLTLRLVGDDTSINLPFDSNNSFILPPKEVVADEDADLVLNKRKGGYNWLPVIRSVGVPEGMRRVGDLRLECKVMIATVKQEVGLIKTAFLNSIMLTTNWCMQKRYEEVNLPSFSEHPLAGATLVEGDKRTELKIEDDPTVFIAPLADSKVSDDAMVELRYANVVPL